MLINYAHRGASADYPENTLSAFYAGLDMGANGIETDVQRTRDGVLVLFHDHTLERVTGEPGSISDYTVDQLRRFVVRNPQTGRCDIIPTLSDFLRCFSWRDLTFAIELKQEHIEAQTLELLNAYGLRDKTIVTSFEFDNLARVKALDPRYRVGYLFRPDIQEDPVRQMRSIGGEQLCPKAEMLTPELVRTYHELGFSVRAWGVSTEEWMLHAYRCGVDGMTVNFPDKLTALLQGEQENQA